MNNCQDCANWRLKDAGQMSAHGYGVCCLGPKWRFFGPTHQCDRHWPATADVTAARVAWLEKK